MVVTMCCASCSLPEAREFGGEVLPSNQTVDIANIMSEWSELNPTTVPPPFGNVTGSGSVAIHSTLLIWLVIGISASLGSII